MDETILFVIIMSTISIIWILMELYMLKKDKVTKSLGG